MLILMVAVGVGVSIIFGVFKMRYEWSLKPLVTAILVPLLALTLFMESVDELAPVGRL